MTDMSVESKSAPDFTTAQIASYFKVKVGTVRSWVADGCPAERRGKGKPIQFSLERVKEWKRLSASAGADLDPQREKAMLDRERRLKVAAERKALEGKLVKVTDVEDYWGQMVGAARAKLLSLPIKLAPVVMSCTTLMEVQDEAQRLIGEALEELAGDGVPHNLDLETTAETDGQSVVGQIPEAVSGVERGTGPVEDEPSTVPEGDTGRTQ